ncbi:MAG TPA: hypothetical protein VE991_01780 [Acidimicrobiales bacterium]|nr:hypothetical protein [Acidimicrobiales bacterium]
MPVTDGNFSGMKGRHDYRHIYTLSSALDSLAPTAHRGGDSKPRDDDADDHE